MSRIRLLVGTRKGAFILTSDGTRKQWHVNGPHFAGWELYHLKGSRVDPNRLYASQSSSWFGQIIQRSDDGGKTWHPPGTRPEDLMGSDGMPKGESNMFVYEARDGTVGTHKWYDGTQHPWEFKRVWHLEPSLTDPDTVYAGVEDAALFQISRRRENMAGDGGAARRKRTSLAAWRRRDVPAYDPVGPSHPERIYVAISAAGAFRSDDAGKTWRPMNRGLKSQYELPDPDAEVGHCVHRIDDASFPSERSVHAEALGRHAERRCGGVVARNQRELADRLRVSDRRARA